MHSALKNEVARGGLQNRLAERNEGSGNEIAPFQTGAVPDLHAGVFTIVLVCIPKKRAVLLAQSINCLALENIASSFFEAKVSFE